MTKEEVIKIVGHIDDTLIIEIIRSGATGAELQEAFEWVFSDDSISKESLSQPHGKIANLCTILERSETDREFD